VTAGFVALGYKLPWRYDETRLPAVERARPVDPYASGYVVPAMTGQAAPEVGRQLHDLIHWAGWSNRDLAAVIGSSHPTIAQALQGHAAALSRSAAQRRRLGETHDVVSRIHALTGRDAERTARVLDTPGSDDVTATEHLAAGEPVKAYLTAIRVLRPSRARGMMIGRHPIDPRRATAAILDRE
jgi:hypothetical protein